LIELDGEDLRRAPLELRKARLRGLLQQGHPGIAFNTHYIVAGAIVFKNACALGCEGIVSKRLGSPYRSSRSAHWVKVKNPSAPAVDVRLKKIGDEAGNSRHLSHALRLRVIGRRARSIVRTSLIESTRSTMRPLSKWR